MPEHEFKAPKPVAGLVWLPLAILVAVYLPTLRELVVDWWTDANYSHGFLVPIISFYLIWSEKSELARIVRRPSRYGIVVLLAGIALFVVGTAAAEYFTARLSFVICLFGLVWYLYGNEFIRRTWFAFFFLCFMIPVPYVVYYAVAFPLQLFATKVTVAFLDLLGMGVARQGNIIHLASGQTLEVAEACSGMRSLVSLLALGALYAYWNQKRLAARAILFFSTIPIAVLANVFRVVTTSILVTLVSVQVTEEPLHTIMGLSVFAIAFICLFIEGAILQRWFR